MALPHLISSRPFLTECGMETTIFYKHNIPLPCFSSTPLIDTEAGRTLITSFYHSYANIAASHRTGKDVGCRFQLGLFSQFSKIFWTTTAW
ncbi:hypothetical protein BDV59DRAFT_175236 [Aspergillus ambiguus]|uniref:uncharacterized protein n=1 Tax=Aspergillus ambiguus TaxID=176160 RepID=UPI003CCD9E5E